MSAAAEAFRMGREHEASGDVLDAVQSYKTGCLCLQRLLDRESNVASRSVILEKMEEYSKHAHAIKAQALAAEAAAAAAGAPQAPQATATAVRRGALASTQRADAESVVDEMFGADMVAAHTSFKDVVGLEEAKTTVVEVFEYPRRFPSQFTAKTAPKWSGMMLYGPPGTGKTQFARACATELGCAFFSVRVSDIMSRWLGDSEKIVQRLFQRARDKAPSLVFIDEIDALVGTRGSDSESESARRVKTELLTQTEGLDTDPTKRVLLVGATNAPWDMDPALLRRLAQHIFVGLPTKENRVELLRQMTDLDAEDLEHVAELTEGYSGSDLRGVAQLAGSMALREHMSARAFERDPKTHKWWSRGGEAASQHLDTCASCFFVVSNETRTSRRTTNVLDEEVLKALREPAADRAKRRPKPCAECGWVVGVTTLDFLDMELHPKLPDVSHFLAAVRQKPPTVTSQALRRFDEYRASLRAA